MSVVPCIAVPGEPVLLFPWLKPQVKANQTCRALTEWPTEPASTDQLLSENSHSNDQRRARPTAAAQLHPRIFQVGKAELRADSTNEQRLRVEERVLTSAIFSTALPFRSKVGV